MPNTTVTCRTACAMTCTHGMLVVGNQHAAAQSSVGSTWNSAFISTITSWWCPGACMADAGNCAAQRRHHGGAPSTQVRDWGWWCLDDGAAGPTPSPAAVGAPTGGRAEQCTHTVCPHHLIWQLLGPVAEVLYVHLVLAPAACYNMLTLCLHLHGIAM
jgi:hypothetical protein